MLATQKKVTNRTKKLNLDREQLEYFKKQMQDNYTKQLIEKVIQTITLEHSIEELEENIRAFQMTKPIGSKEQHQQRVCLMQDQLYTLKKKRAASNLKTETHIRSQLAHQDQLQHTEKQVKKQAVTQLKMATLANVPRKKRNSKKWKLVPLYKVIVSPLEIEKKGCIFFTKDRKEFVSLYNDLLINPTTLELKTFREVLAVTQHVRNSDGEIIYKYSKNAFRPVKWLRV